MRARNSNGIQLMVRCRQYLVTPIVTLTSKLHRKVPPIILAIIILQTLWLCYDTKVTSQKRYRPKWIPIPITDSSPLSPFYSTTTTTTSSSTSYEGYTRVFPIYKYPYPCGPLMDQKDFSSRKGSEEGLLYLQQAEVASTIFAGITARIARRMAGVVSQQQRQKQLPSRNKNCNTTTTAISLSALSATRLVCTARLMPLRGRKFAYRDVQKSFLWTVVREPVERIVSKYFHYGIQRQRRSKGSSSSSSSSSSLWPFSMTRFKDYTLTNEYQDYGYYYRSLAVLRNMNPYDVDSYGQYIQEILDSYNFIGVSERMDETLVVLKLLLGLEIQDVLFLPDPPKATTTANNNNDNKQNNDKKVNIIKNENNGVTGSISYYDYWDKNDCRLIPEVQVTMEMKEWFYTEEFYLFTHGDVLFYKAVNASLDRTIDALGRDVVEKGVKQLRWALSQANKACPNAKHRCSTDGVVQSKTDCLFSDVGCGYECLDTVAQTLSTNSDFPK